MLTERVRTCEHFQCDDRATVRFRWPQGTVYYCATHAASAEANYQRSAGAQPIREEGRWPSLWAEEPAEPPPDTPLPEWCVGMNALLRELGESDAGGLPGGA
jgi:hypothetical protein